MALLPLLTFLLVLAAAIDGTRSEAIVSGTVFCDQCKDGQVSVFDYPILGMKVTMNCPGSDGKMKMLEEETTNWLGNYNIRMDGSPDLRGCIAQVSSSGQGSMECGAASGQPQNLRLMFKMLDMEFYTVDPLISQPARPMPFCPRPSPHLVPPPPARAHTVPQLPPVPVPHLPPVSQLPPMPKMPPMPFLEASACSHQMWTMPMYECYWRVLPPDTKVAGVFGALAARRYGTDITLRGSMDGRGDPYKTLLREGTTALLNSYNSVRFTYTPLGVIEHMNWALLGSTSQVLHTAFHFMKANSGDGNIPCRFTSCHCFCWWSEVSLRCQKISSVTYSFIPSCAQTAMKWTWSQHCDFDKHV